MFEIVQYISHSRKQETIPMKCEIICDVKHLRCLIMKEKRERERLSKREKVRSLFHEVYFLGEQISVFQSCCGIFSNRSQELYNVTQCRCSCISVSWQGQRDKGESLYVSAAPPLYRTILNLHFGLKWIVLVQQWVRVQVVAVNACGKAYRDKSISILYIQTHIPGSIFYMCLPIHLLFCVCTSCSVFLLPEGLVLSLIKCISAFFFLPTSPWLLPSFLLSFLLGYVSFCRLAIWG